ncbi:MAG: 16S rRNA (adenine(1518)-N(6)/adenine(1519)-N(6))-dimethyltransferase RsmA [bacterium]
MGRSAAGRRFTTRQPRGQHFLVDASCSRRILECAGLSPEEEVIEIGAGFGALTIPLSTLVSRVIAIELDEGLVRSLHDRIAGISERVTILHADVMRVDFTGLCSDLSRPPVVLGNLPYYLATALIQRLLSLGTRVDRMVFMVQKEVAERIVAGPPGKAYGYLSLIVEYRAEADYLFDIPPSVFKPRPRVESSVIRLRPRSSPPVEVKDEQLLFRIIQSGFRHRRKTLVNALRLDPQFDSLDIEEIVQGIGCERRVRAEVLRLEDFACLSNVLFDRLATAPCPRDQGPSTCHS